MAEYKLSFPSGDRPWNNLPTKTQLQEQIAHGLFIKGPAILGKVTGMAYKLKGRALFAQQTNANRTRIHSRIGSGHSS